MRRPTHLRKIGGAAIIFVVVWCGGVRGQGLLRAHEETTLDSAIDIFEGNRKVGDYYGDKTPFRFQQIEKSHPGQAIVALYIGASYCTYSGRNERGSDIALSYADTALIWFHEARRRDSLVFDEANLRKSVLEWLQQAYYLQGLNYLHSKRFADFRSLVAQSREALTVTDIALARNRLRACDRNGILFIEDDRALTGLVAYWYVQVLEGYRQDIVVFPTNIVGEPWFQQALNDGIPGILPSITFPVIEYKDVTGVENVESWRTDTVRISSKVAARLRELTGFQPPPECKLDVQLFEELQCGSDRAYEKIGRAVFRSIIAATKWERPLYMIGYYFQKFDSLAMRDEGYFEELLPWKISRGDSLLIVAVSRDSMKNERLFGSDSEWSAWAGSAPPFTSSEEVPFDMAERAIDDNKDDTVLCTRIFDCVWRVHPPLLPRTPYTSLAILADGLHRHPVEYLTRMKDTLRKVMFASMMSEKLDRWVDAWAARSYVALCKQLGACDEARRAARKLRYLIEREGDISRRKFISDLTAFDPAACSVDTRCSASLGTSNTRLSKDSLARAQYDDRSQYDHWISPQHSFLTNEPVFVNISIHGSHIRDTVLLKLFDQHTSTFVQETHAIASDTVRPYMNYVYTVASIPVAKAHELSEGRYRVEAFINGEPVEYTIFELFDPTVEE